MTRVVVDVAYTLDALAFHPRSVYSYSLARRLAQGRPGR
jgi:hypothetical protein